MTANDPDPLDNLLETIEREPSRRRAFWKKLAEHLRERRARLPVTKPAQRRAAVSTGAAGAAPERAEPARRRIRGLRLLLLIAGLAGAPFQFTPQRRQH